jgi:hypothetical protein
MMNAHPAARVACPDCDPCLIRARLRVMELAAPGPRARCSQRLRVQVPRGPLHFPIASIGTGSPVSSWNEAYVKHECAECGNRVEAASSWPRCAATLWCDPDAASCERADGVGTRGDHAGSEQRVPVLCRPLSIGGITTRPRRTRLAARARGAEQVDEVGREEVARILRSDVHLSSLLYLTSPAAPGHVTLASWSHACSAARRCLRC